jgi:hypothetical protein
MFEDTRSFAVELAPKRRVDVFISFLSHWTYSIKGLQRLYLFTYLSIHALLHQLGFEAVPIDFPTAKKPMHGAVEVVPKYLRGRDRKTHVSGRHIIAYTG